MPEKIEDIDLIVDYIETMTHDYNIKGEKIPTFCMFKALNDNFGLTDRDIIDIAKQNDYKVFKLSSNEYFEGGLAIANKECTEEQISSEVNEFSEEDGEITVTDMFKEKEEDLTTKTGYAPKMTEKIEKQPNIDYKGFTIEHSPMEMHYGDEKQDIDGWYIHSPYYLQSNSNKEKFFLPLFAEDEFGVVQNFKTAEEAKEYIDKWMVTKKGKTKLKGWKKDECHFEILPEYRKEKEESLKESSEEEVVEETKEYKIVKTNSISYKSKNGVAVGKPIKKPIFQVYFRTQDFNPSVNRWMNRGWSLQLTDFKTLEDARAYVKKYGKELKDEADESFARISYEQSQDKQSKKNKKVKIIYGNSPKEAKAHPPIRVTLKQLDDYKDNYSYVEVVDEGLEEDIEKHEELNPVLFEDNKLKPEIREAMQKVADAFVDDLKEDEISIKVNDIILVGSNCSYNYTKDSDLDIHIIADSKALECPKELVDKLYSAYRSIFNKNYDITIKGIPAEIYVELDTLGATKSNGIYSIMKDEWIKEPVQQDIPDLDQEAFDKLFSEWEDRYFDLVGGQEIEEPEFIDTLEESNTTNPEYDYYEVYCEKGEDLEYSNDNFSLCIKLPRGAKEPEEEDVEAFFKDNYPEVIKDYHVVGVWNTIDDFADDKISLGDFETIYDYKEPIVASLNESLYDDIDKFITDIYDLRKTSIAKDGEYSLGNLVFKEFRNLGYLDNLKELKKQERAKELSLEQLGEAESKETKTRKKVNKLYRDSRGHHGGTYKIDYSKYPKDKLANKFSVAIKSLSKNWSDSSYKEVPSDEFKKEVRAAVKRAKENNLDAVGTWMPDYTNKCSVDVCRIFADEYEANKFAYEQGEDEYGVFDSTGNYAYGKKPVPPEEFSK